MLGERVSVALLTLDAGPLFDSVLEGLARQRLAGLGGLVAVDSGSTDGTLERLERAGALIHKIALEDFDFGLTRDLVFAMADGEIIVSLSQDVVLTEPDALEQLVAPLDDPGVAAVSAHLAPPEDRPLFLWQRMGRFYFTREMETFRRRYGKPLSHALSATRRDVWAKLRHGAMPIAEDMQFQRRVIEAGYRVAHVAKPLGTHANVYSFASLVKRCFNEGLAARRLELPYGTGKLLADLARLDLWLALGRQVSYGRLRSAAEALYPVLRPLAVYAGHRFGKGYWR